MRSITPDTIRPLLKPKHVDALEECIANNKLFEAGLIIGVILKSIDKEAFDKASQAGIDVVKDVEDIAPLKGALEETWLSDLSTIIPLVRREIKDILDDTYANAELLHSSAIRATMIASSISALRLTTD